MEKFKVYDSSEYPLLSVSPELSDLAESSKLAKKMKSEFPNLEFSAAVIADGNVLIQDLAPLQARDANCELTNKARELNRFSTRTMQVVDGQEATLRMLELLKQEADAFQDSTVIYPLGAGKIVKQYITTELERNPSFSSLGFLKDGVELPVTRTMIDKGVFYITVDDTILETMPTPKRVIVIDDVVASGQTARKIRFLSSMFRYIPCFLATWILLEPKEPNQKITLDLYDKVFAGYVIRGNMMDKPPVNSLSCFVRQEPKDLVIKQKYAQKYISDLDSFNALLGIKNEKE